jgi:hypothetical protein
MSCRGQTVYHNSCSGNGRCLSMRELAKHRKADTLAIDETAAYGSSLWDATTWDADMVSGCAADVYGYYPGTLHNISNTYTERGESSLQCPFGLDHREFEVVKKNDTAWASRTYHIDSRTQVREVQRVSCTADGGSFTLNFRNYTTVSIAYDAEAADIEAALEALSSIGDVTIEIQSDSDAPSSACSATAATNHYFDVYFITEISRLPLLRLDSTALLHDTSNQVDKVLDVEETVAGEGVLKECSGKGECDRSTGICKCWPNWGSSDGFGGRGIRGDCGFSLIV